MRIAALACFAPALQVLPRLSAVNPRQASTLQTNHEAFELVQWIRAAGGSCEGLHIAVQEALGQTLVASRTIREGQQLVALPRSRQLWAASQDATLQSLIDKVPPDLWAARLALPIISERAKGGGSDFLPYLHSLPAGIQGLPIFFQPQDMQQLQYPPLVQQVTMRCRWMLKFASEELSQPAAASAFAGVNVDVNLLGWGLGTASSRAFRIGPKGEPAMLPLIDLCNHSFTPNCRLERQPDGTAVLVSLTAIPEDTPLTISYGQLSNTELLQDYGFVVENNPHDALLISLSANHIQVAQTLAGIDMPSEPQPWQAAALAKLAGGGVGSVQITRKKPTLDPRLVAATRVLCSSSPSDLASRGLQELGDLNRPLAKPVEAKALGTLAAMCAQLLAVMGTTAQEDHDLLSSTESHLSANGRLAVTYRLQLKNVVGEALSLVLERAKALKARN